MSIGGSVRTHWQRWSGTVACLGTAGTSVVVCVWLGRRSQHSPLGQAIDQQATGAVAATDAGISRMVGLLGTIWGCVKGIVWGVGSFGIWLVKGFAR